MLSRTAENLFWMTRYMERAETMARLLEVGYRIALMPSAGTGHQNDWASILAAAGGAAAFASRYGETTPATVETFLFFDRENTSSVANCIARARDNARVVRTAVTSEVWDALNGAFQDMKAFERRGPGRADLMSLCDWTKRQTALLRGAIENTQLQQDGYDFMKRVRQMQAPMSSVPAAALTALARVADRRRALLAGFQTHLTKPVDPAELVATVASLAGRTGKSYI